MSDEQPAVQTPETVAPKPRPMPRPMPPSSTAPTPAPVVDADAERAATFGRVDDDGTVYVRDGDTERVVGQVPGATGDDALSLYVRRYLDLTARAALLEARIDSPDVTPNQIENALSALAEEAVEPAAVGNLAELRSRLDKLAEQLTAKRAAAAEARAAAKAQAEADRLVLVERAEALAAADTETIRWKAAGEELRDLLAEWKQAQRRGPRIDKPVEDELWKRFSQARTTFDRSRRAYFAQLEEANKAAKAAKTALVEEAEALSTTTDWAAGAAGYRDLMAQWRVAGRAGRKVDDALWARFRAAQDVFFAARDAAVAATEAEFEENLAAKQELLAEAEALVPVTDLAAAKAAIRSIQERWEQIGKVPRAALSSVEGRLRAVETAIRDAESATWRRTDPEKQARAEGMLEQLETAIAAAREALAAAEARGDTRAAKKAQEEIDTKTTWLETIQRSSADL
jgi:hypothetical protein